MPDLSQLAISQIILIAAGVLGVLLIVLAAISPTTRDKLALLGLRVADVMVAFLEAQLKPATRAARYQTLTRRVS